MAIEKEINVSGSQVKIYYQTPHRIITADDINTISGVNLNGSQLQQLINIIRSIYNKTENIYLGFKNVSFNNTSITIDGGRIITNDAVYQIDPMTLQPTNEAYYGIYEIELISILTDDVSKAYFDITTETIQNATTPTRKTFTIKLYEKYETTANYPTTTPGRIELLKYKKNVPFGNIIETTYSINRDLDLSDKPDTFLELLDTPNTYTGFQGKLLRVNPNGTGLEFDNFSYSTYSKMKVGNSFPTSPNHSDLFYNQTNNTLWRYDAISSNWIPIDWQTIIKASPEYIAGRLRVNSTTGKLEISPNGTNWYECIPAVGSAAVELTTLDNTNFTYKYWIAPGQTAIIKNANHVPIVYQSSNRVVFDYRFYDAQNRPAFFFIGIRPSNIAISDGRVNYIGKDDGNFTYAYSYSSLNMVVLCAYITYDATPAIWCSGTIQIKDNVFSGNYYGLTGMSFVEIATTLGTASSTSYWLGSVYEWNSVTFNPFSYHFITLTRIA